MHIGLIAELENNNAYPSINAMINKPIKEKSAVLDYMKSGNVIAAAPAILKDVLNPNIKIPELLLMSDGDYEWRSDIIYYVEQYDLELPECFIKHAIGKNQSRSDKKLS